MAKFVEIKDLNNDRYAINLDQVLYMREIDGVTFILYSENVGINTALSIDEINRL